MKLPLPQSKKKLLRVVGMLVYYAKLIFNFSEKVRPLVQAFILPSTSDATLAFETLNSDLPKARLNSIDEYAPFTVECDASN